MGLIDNSVAQTAVITGCVTLAGLVAAYVYQTYYKKKDKIPTKWAPVGYISKIYLYPLKSGNKVPLTKAECSEYGLREIRHDKLHRLRDRGLVVYKEGDNEFRTARTYPNMLQIDVSVHDEEHFAIDAPSMRTLYVKIPKDKNAKKTSIKFWNKETIALIDCGDEAATWLSRYILSKASGLRLGFNDASTRRDITKTHQPLLKYYKNLSNKSTGLCSDLSSLLVVSQASVNDMNTRIDNSNVTVENFRPNIVVDGPELKAYAEDDWDYIKIGDQVIARNVKECTRCILTTINPDSGIRNQNKEPLKTLEKYRMSNGPEKSPVMGLNLEVKKTGVVKLGDQIFMGVPDEE